MELAIKHEELIDMVVTARPMASDALALETVDMFPFWIDYINIPITQEMVAVEGSSMGLLPGNIVTLDTLAKGMLLSSGNDAANSAAISIAGSLEAFSQMRNEKAAQIGIYVYKRQGWGAGGGLYHFGCGYR